jgi:hypothetical protein
MTGQWAALDPLIPEPARTKTAVAALGKNGARSSTEYSGYCALPLRGPIYPTVTPYGQNIQMR